MNLGLLPSAAITIPFFSAGGSNMVSSYILTGLVLSIQTIMSKGVRIARSSGLKLPMTVPYAAFVIGFALMVLFCLGSIANRIAKHKAEKSGKEDV